MTLHIDCDTCLARGPACHDCVVTVLIGPPPELRSGPHVGPDAQEWQALDVLADFGMVPPLRLVRPMSGPEVESA